MSRSYLMPESNTDLNQLLTISSEDQVDNRDTDTLLAWLKLYSTVIQLEPHCIITQGNDLNTKWMAPE